MAQEENKIKPKLLIVTGPQGPGNHLFAKLFSLHPAVEGWRMQINEWQGHHEEPFSPAWDKPQLLKDKPWKENSAYMTSISCPYIKGNQPQVPKYSEFISEAKKHCDVIIAIIGRDRNILEIQQKRLRGEHTTPQAMEQFQGLDKLAPTYYISQELFFLYGSDYMMSLGRQMNFPVLCPSELYKDFMRQDSNMKYTKFAEGKYDAEVKKACEES